MASRDVQTGFSLLELLIAMAIAGILVVVAVIAYYDYVMRARMTELFSFADKAKTAVSEIYYSTGQLPNNNSEASFSPYTASQASIAEGKYSAKFTFVTVSQNSTILMYDYLFNYNLTEQQLIDLNLVIVILKPSVQGNLLTWQCGVPGNIVADVNKIFRYVPASCRNVLNL